MMSWAIRILGLVLLAVCPKMATAQGVSHSNQALAAYDAAPAAYPQPYGADRNVGDAAANTPAIPLVSQEAGDRKDKSSMGGVGSAVAVAGSLAVALGGFFLVVWFLRKTSLGGQARLPGEVFEILGRAPLANQQQACLLRCGGKLILVAVSMTGSRTLAEIADPAEAERLAALCRQTRPTGGTASFRQVFRQMEKHDA